MLSSNICQNCPIADTLDGGFLLFFSDCGVVAVTLISVSLAFLYIDFFLFERKTKCPNIRIICLAYKYRTSLKLSVSKKY